MKLIRRETLEIKKSKFISYYYEIETVEQAKQIIRELKQNNKKARHIPYAFKVSNTAGKSDDKEPSNTAGLPLYNLLEKRNKNNCLIAVVRYFGGIKLGAGGLLRAYTSAANKALGDEKTEE